MDIEMESLKNVFTETRPMDEWFECIKEPWKSALIKDIENGAQNYRRDVWNRHQLRAYVVFDRAITWSYESNTEDWQRIFNDARENPEKYFNYPETAGWL
jgi:hypothetical protein